MSSLLVHNWPTSVLSSEAAHAVSAYHSEAFPRLSARADAMDQKLALE